MGAAHFTSNHLYFMAYGTLWTVVLSAIALTGGGLAGFLIALCRVSASRFLRNAVGCYVQLIQGIPLLVIMFLSYFGLAAIGIKISPLAAASVSMTIYVSAYLGEIWRGCIQSVPRAQWEAAECLALSRIQRMFKVILPQAIHIATPPFRPDHQKHVAGFGARLRRACPFGTDHQQLDFRTLSYLHNHRSGLFLVVLSAFSLEPEA